MSDAIKNAIEAMEFAQHAVGPFNRVATKKLRESIAELQAAQAQAQAQAGDAEAEYGRGYYDGRKSNIDQVPEFWYEALEKITQEYEELFIYYKDEREKDGWDSPECPQTLLEVRELLKGFNPAPPAAAVNQQLLESLVDLLKAARGGIKLDAPELSIGYIDAAIDAIAAAQEQSK